MDGNGFAGIPKKMMDNISDENHFNIIVNEKTYHVTVFYEDVYLSHFKIETNGKYLVTLSMDEDGNWRSEDNATEINEDMIEQIGKAIEEFDVH